jgi:N-acetylmuramoyl-L-alanine amidase-like protein
MRRFLVAVLLLLCAAPPASASGPRAHDFERSLPSSPGAHAARTSGTTRLVRPGRRFDVFGLRWRRAPRFVHVHARVHDPRRGWRRWVELGVADSGAHGTDPAWAGGADALQLRLVGRPLGARLHFVRVRSPRRAPRARAAQTAFPGAPPIVPRSEWGGDQCPPRATPQHGEVKLAFVHHTVTANDYGPEDSRSMVLGICRFHRNSNGWNDIGYNFLVDKYGTLFEGRAGGIDQAIVGAQAQGFNSVSTGISNLGTYQDVPQSEAALDAIGRLLAWKLPLHGAPVEGQVTVTSAGGDTNRYPSGRAVTFERISGHRDGNSTECPGDQLYAQLPRVRELAAGRAPATVPPETAGIPAAITLQPAAPVFLFPQPIAVSGRLTDAAGAGVGDRRVKIEIGTTQGWVGVTATTTAPDGSWSAQFSATRSWDVRAIWNDVASPRTRVVVAPVLSARLRASRVKAGRSAVVTGGVRPQKGSVLVEAWRQANPASTRFVRSFTLRSRTRAGGRFRAAVPLRRPGLYRLRVRFPGDRRNGPAQAADLFVRAVRGRVSGAGGVRAGR